MMSCARAVHLFFAWLLVISAANGNVIEEDSSQCSLTEQSVENLLAPILSLVRGGDNSTDSSEEFDTDRSQCHKKLNPLVMSMTTLVMCGEIINPDESQDNAILDERFDRFLAAYQKFKNASDTSTRAFLDKLEPEVRQYKSKVLEFKNSPEHKMLRIIFKGRTTEAANKTELLDNSSDFMLKVVNLGYNPINNNFLKYLIRYTFEFNSFELSIKGYTQLLNNIKRNYGRRHEPEILLIDYFCQHDIDDQEFADQTEETKNEYRNFSQHIQPLKLEVIQNIVVDFNNKDYSALVSLGQGMDYQILNKFIPDFVQQMYTPANLTKVASLLDLFRNFPYMNNDCAAVETLYTEMKKNGHENTTEAFALWLYVRYAITQNSNTFSLVDDANKAKCQHVFDSLAFLLDSNLVKYKELMAAKAWLMIRNFHRSYPISFRWFLPDVVNSFYQGDKDSIATVLQLVDILPFVDDECITLETLTAKIKSLGQQNIFEALQVYARLEESFLQSMDRNVVALYQRMCHRSVHAAPQWIKSLILFADTSACKVKNRKFDEYLMVEVENDSASNRTFLNVYSDKASDQQKWNVTVDKNGFAYFLNSQQQAWHLSRGDGSPIIVQKNSTDWAMKIEDVKWRIENADGGFFHIFYLSPSNEKMYLASTEAKCKDSFRCVEGTADLGVSKRTEWTIEC